MKVWLDEARLQLREIAPDDLVPVDEDEFLCRREPWRVRFLRDQTGAVSTIEVDFLRRTIRGEKSNRPRYVGSHVCMQCHTGDEHGNQSVVWMRSRHAHAYWNLGTDWALFLARLRRHYQDLEDPMTDGRCLLCHTTGAQEDSALFESSYRPQEGVSCEACHGPGSHYATVDNMADRESYVAAGGRIPDASTCRTCHRRSENFDFDEMWPKIAHSKHETE